jgi:hypothetical protein
MRLFNQSTLTPLGAPPQCTDLTASDAATPSSPEQAARTAARTAVDDGSSYEAGVLERWPMSTLRQQQRVAILPYRRESPSATELPEARPAAANPMQGDSR